MNPITALPPAVRANPEPLAMSTFARTIYEQKYAWRDEAGEVAETWIDTAFRVTYHVLGALDIGPTDEAFIKIFDLIASRKFLPGGRYLYASGRGLHQVQNCLLLKAEDTREGWADLLSKAAMALQTGAGIGVVYSDVRCSGSPIKRTGGVASGPMALMQMVNEIGRGVMQGGARRSAIWAGLKWSHQDISQFIRCKDWSEELRALKEKDPNFPLPMEFTNMSIILDDDFFEAYEDREHPLHYHAHHVYAMGVQYMVKTAEPGFSVDVGDNAGESLRNAPVAGDTHILTFDGYMPVTALSDRPVTVWTGHRWAENVVFSKTYENAPILRVEMTGGRMIRCEPNHEFLVERYTGTGVRRKLDGISRIKASELRPGDNLHVSPPQRDFDRTSVDTSSYEMGYLYGDGSFHKAGGADVSFCTEDSKKAIPLMVGAASINECDGRGYARAYYAVSDRFAGRDKAVFPSDMFGASPVSLASFIAGLFDADGNYELTQRRIRLASKHQGFLRGVARVLEQLGIIAGISKAGTSTYGRGQGWQLVVMADFHDLFASMIPTQRLEIPTVGKGGYRKSAIKVVSVTEDGHEDVYCADVQVAEHSFMAEGVIISNCTEVTSHDDSDICNLGSINMARIDTEQEFLEAVKYGTLFLLAGTVYSDLPYEKVNEIRRKNRRLGLGVMGIAEWLLQRGYRYEPNAELGSWLEKYAESTEIAAAWADDYGLSHPVKTRAIAPTGTIGIIAETTTGIEPIFCVAYKRRYKEARADGLDLTRYQYVVDPTAKRLIDQGADPQSIEDAYVLSYNVERRVAFQAWVQQYVDHGISSTINLPYAITDPTEVADFAEMLYGYLPKLRGITVYPDGARGGQPLTAVSFDVAKDQVGVVFEEDENNACKSGSCGV